MNRKICEMVNEVVVAALTSGVVPWKEREFIHKPAVNAKLKEYSLVNQWLLQKGGEWLTFKEVVNRGGNVKKGEKSKFVIFWTMYNKPEKDSNGKNVLDENGNVVIEKKIPCLKYYHVFHISQCEGIESRYGEETTQRVEQADDVIANYMKANPGLTVAETTEKPNYMPSTDTIHIPAITDYMNTNDYYAEMFHEMTHSTGHRDRLNRYGDTEKEAAFDDMTSKEELIAEIGSSVLLTRCGIETDKTREESMAYIQKWLEAIKHDETLVMSAVGKAEKALNYILPEVDDAE